MATRVRLPQERSERIHRACRNTRTSDVPVRLTLLELYRRLQPLQELSRLLCGNLHRDLAPKVNPSGIYRSYKRQARARIPRGAGTLARLGQLGNEQWVRRSIPAVSARPGNQIAQMIRRSIPCQESLFPAILFAWPGSEKLTYAGSGHAHL